MKFYFFEDEGRTATILISARYVAMIETFIKEQFENLANLDNSWLQKYSVTAHTTRLSMVDHVISQLGNIYWSLRIPELT